MFEFSLYFSLLDHQAAALANGNRNNVRTGLLKDRAILTEHAMPKHASFVWLEFIVAIVEARVRFADYARENPKQLPFVHTSFPGTRTDLLEFLAIRPISLC